MCATMPDNICGAPQLGQCSDDDKCECFPDGVDCTTGAETSDSTGVETGDGSGLGDACDQDRDCATFLCWDFKAHDPMCGGKYCSAPCSSDQECIDLADAAGAPTPNDAFCGTDDQCNLVTTGLPRGLFCA